MAIRNLFVITLVAAGAAMAGLPVPAGAQQPSHAIPPQMLVGSTGLGLSDGMITSVEGLELAPGETVIEGPPEIRMLSEQINGGGSSHVHGSPFGNNCGPECYTACEPGYYVIGDALYMNRTGLGGFTRSTGFAFDDFDFELAPRITIGRQFDCTDGYEFVLAGLLEWEERLTATAAGLSTPMFAIAPLNATVFDPFANSTTQEQGIRAEYNSFEFNRTYNGWDVVRTMIGIRTVLYEEDYYFSATDGTDNGLLTQSAENFLVGPQIGIEMLYPIANRVDVGARLKGALFLNIAEAETRLFNDSVSATIPVAGGSASGNELSGMFEMNFSFRYRVTSSLTATAGYEVWYMGGLIEAESQLPLGFTQFTGGSMEADDDVFIHGLSLGAQWVF